MQIAPGVSLGVDKSHMHLHGMTRTKSFGKAMSIVSICGCKLLCTCYQ